MFFPSCAIEPEDSNDVITIILVLEIHKFSMAQSLPNDRLLIVALIKE